MGALADVDLAVGEDGSFEVLLGPARPAGWSGPFIELDGDAPMVLTRDSQVDPAAGRRVEWAIEAIDAPDSYRHTDADMASWLAAVGRWTQAMMRLVPVGSSATGDRTSVGHERLDVVHAFTPPYRIGEMNYGWSASDATYSYAPFDLADGEVLLVTHRPPRCRFWNVTLWNPFMACFDASFGRTSWNGGSATLNADGTVTVAVSLEPTGHVNSISTLGHRKGIVAFRWFCADELPEVPTIEVASLDRLPPALGRT